MNTKTTRFFVSECCICTDDIHDDDKIWYCEQCTVSIHLDCISGWLGTRIKGTIWNCPICRFEVTKMPDFRCYCGKVVNPEPNLYGSPQQTICKHPCPDRCHPGACESCASVVIRNCFCGKTNDRMKCSMLNKLDEYPFNFSCNHICGKMKNCNIHKCDLTCHSGPCPNCDIVIGIAKCYSHHSTCNVMCGSSLKNFSCNERCNKLLPCGNHYCMDMCHEGQCPLCPTDIHAVKTCPCGKVPISSLLFGSTNRTSCLDGIPSCGQICGKTLECSSDSKEIHKCQKICHNGSCPPCDFPLDKQCRCGSKTFKTTCKQFREKDFVCKKRCKLLKKCHRHKCDTLCCDIPPSHHLCLLTCGSLLSCGKHTCTKPCHPKGLCGKCNHYDNEALECNCGKIKILPPILCGSKLDSCSELCPKEQPCGHSQTHLCHFKNIECSPCHFLVEKYCLCGKVKQTNVPCYKVDITCNMVCGKLLPCSNALYPHYCTRSCHSGDCNRYSQNDQTMIQMVSKYYKVIPNTLELKCTQLCRAKRPCGHPCNMPCHDLLPCPPSKCFQDVLVSCSCGELIERKLCHLLNINKTSPKHSIQCHTQTDSNQLESCNIYLECNEKCQVVQRNKKLAEALDLDVISHYKGFYPKKSNNMDNPDYSEFLLNCVAKHRFFVVAVEELFSMAISRIDKITSDEYEHKLKLQIEIFSDKSAQIWKRIIHEYSEHFGCYYHFSNNYIKITTLKNVSKVPSKLLSCISLFN